MKKNVIAVLLAVVMALGNVGTVPILAAEATTQEAVDVEKETVEDATEISEEANTVDALETTAQEANTAEEYSTEQEVTEQPESDIEEDRGNLDSAQENESADEGADYSEEESNRFEDKEAENSSDEDEKIVDEQSDFEEISEQETVEEAANEEAIAKKAASDAEKQDGIYVGDLGEDNSIDGVAYEFEQGKMTDFVANEIANIWLEWPTEPNAKVVYELRNGKITRFARLKTVLNPSLSVIATPDTLVYQNGSYNHETMQARVTISCKIGRLSPFTESELVNVDGLNIGIKELELYFDKDTLNFGVTGTIFKRTVTNQGEKDLTVTFGNPQTFYYDFYVKDGYVPEEVTETVDVKCTATDSNGVVTSCWPVSVSIGNLDLQKKIAEDQRSGNTYAQKLAEARKQLDACTAITLDSKLSDYFSDEQIKQIEDFLVIYFAQIINADKLENADYFTRITDKVKTKIKKKILSKLGVSSKVLLFSKSTKFSVSVRGTTQDYGDVTVEFSGVIDDYTIGESDPYAAMVSINYKVEGDRYSTGTGMATFANLKGFANSMLDFLNIAYSEAWGKGADQVAAMIVSEPVNKFLLDGSFSGKVYDFCKEQAKEGAKKYSIYCPVDVFVYNENNELCGKIVDDEVITSSPDVVLSVNEDKKYVYMAGGNYSLQLEGRDSGSLNYTIEEIDNEENNIIRTVKINDVPLSDGKIYSTVLSDIPFADSDIYTLYDENNDTTVEISSDSYEITAPGTHDEDWELVDGGSFEEGLNWELYACGTLFISGNGSIPDYDSIDPPWDSYKESIKTVIIRDGVDRIGNYTFYKCINLSTISIPGSVTEIGSNFDSVFRGSNNLNCLSSINVSSENSSFSSENGVLYNGDKTELLLCPRLKRGHLSIADSVTVIRDEACYDCQYITSITIPDGVKVIGEEAFYSCGNKSITIPSSVEEIRRDAFGMSSIEELIIADGLKSIGEEAFGRCIHLRRVEIPGSVISIGNWAFASCEELSSIVLHNGIEDLGSEVFLSCKSLNSVLLPESVSNIKTDTFYRSSITEIKIDVNNKYYSMWDNCIYNRDRTKLIYCPENRENKLIIPSGVNTIGEYAVSGCDRLTEVQFPEGIEYIEEAAFIGCDALTEVEIPKGIKSIGYNAFCSCHNLKRVVIGEGPLTTGSSVFYECTALESIELPNGMTNIGGSMFAECENLTSIIIPDTVTSIGNYSFFRCSGITELTLPSNLTSIGESAFTACTALEEITIPDGVTSLKDNTFSYCPGLRSVSIPESVETIRYNCFEDCSNIADVYYAGNEEQWEAVIGYSRVLGFDNANIHFESSHTLSVNDCVIEVDESAVIYDGKAKTPTVTVENGANILEEGRDYQLSYSNNINAGTATVNVSGIGAYSGTVSISFEIVPCKVNNARIRISGITAKNYTGKAQTQAVVVNDGDVKLTKGTDYTVSYKNNTNAGTASVTIKGKGNYTGTATKSFTITPKPVSGLTISGITAKTYTGKAQTQAVVVKDGTTTLVKGTDYTLAYKNNTNAGTASVVITGKGNYTGSVTKTFTIKKAANAVTAKNFVKTYSATAQTFALGATAKGGTLTYASSSSSVTITKAGKVTVKAKFIGKATITITAQNANYNKATKKITVTVNPTKTGIASVTSPAAGQMLVKWKKNAVGTGYQIQYSTSSKFTGAKSAWITKNTVVSKKITNLTKGKKYYVRMRTYKTVGGVKYYSGWCTVKAVTIKK